MAVALRKSLWLVEPAADTVPAGMDVSRDRYIADFGVNLILLRAQAGITSQLDMANLVGVSESTIQRWEAGKALPDAWELRQLTAHLRVDLEELVNPEPLTDRERMLARRGARAARTAAREQ